MKIGFLIIGIILIFGILFTLINSFQLITFFSGFSTIILFIPFINILFSLACLSIILGFLFIFRSCIFIFSNPGMNNFPSFISFNEGFFIKGFVIPLMNNLVAFITFTIKVLLDLISILTTFLDILFTVLTFFGIFKSLVFITLLNWFQFLSKSIISSPVIFKYWVWDGIKIILFVNPNKLIESILFLINGIFFFSFALIDKPVLIIFNGFFTFFLAIKLIWIFSISNSFLISFWGFSGIEYKKLNLSFWTIFKTLIFFFCSLIVNLVLVIGFIISSQLISFLGFNFS